MAERLKRRGKWDKPAARVPTEDDVADQAIRDAVSKAVIDALRPIKNRVIASLGRQEIDCIAASASAAFVKASWARVKAEGAAELSDPLPDLMM